MEAPKLDTWDPVTFARHAVAVDFETHKIQDGLLAPPPVCGSFADTNVSGACVLRADAALDRFEGHLESDVVVGANIAYDLGVLAAARPHAIPAIFRALDEGRVFDVLIAQMLDWIARGLVRKVKDTGPTMLIDPRTGSPLTDPGTGRHAERFNLDLVTMLTTGRTDAKKNAFWRLRYALLEGIPLERWPLEAWQYPIDDAKNTLEAALVQVGAVARPVPHEYLEGGCSRCGALPGSGTMCRVVEPARNLHNHTMQVRAAWAYQLGSIHGMRTDAPMVGAMRVELDQKHTQATETFQAAGFIRGPEHPDCLPQPGKRAGTFRKPAFEVGSEDWKAVARATALAYGARGTCPTCQGSTKARSDKGSLVNCKDCGATGLDLRTGNVPRTPSGDVSVTRDTLKESGDDLLDEYGDVSENEKLRDTYLPFLERGVRTPINLSSNILLATGRASYYGLIQLLPRAGRVRQCFIPGELLDEGRPAPAVFCSIDYSGIEMVALAQSQINLGHDSPLADALNRGDDAHCRLAANFVGMTYEAFLAAYKAGDKKLKSYRQAAKPGNFGYGGGMGAAKFVFTQRLANDVTTGPDGRLYKGIRFCLLLGRAETCGAEKITEWHGRECLPVCKVCTEVADELRSYFVDTWRMRPYFAQASWVADEGGGEIMVPPANRVRGGCNFTQAANGPFQQLAADGMKHAFWEVSRRCYTDRASPMFGDRPLVCIHDELFSVLRARTAHESAHAMRDVMVEAMRTVCPDVLVKAEPALMPRWYKGAEAIYDASGRLIPWRPGLEGFDDKGRPMSVRADAA